MKSLLLRLLVGITILLPLAWLGLDRHYPLLPGPIRLTLSLPAGAAGRVVPLVTTGNTGAGDLLYARYTGPTTLVFGYDSWAVGGPESAAFAFTPGEARPLVIELPSLAAPPRVGRGSQGPLRVVYDGREVLQARVHYYGRQASQVHFGANPIGGTVVNHRFNGTLLTAAGQPLAGRPASLFPWSVRLRLWLSESPLSALLVLAVAITGAILAPRLGRRVRALFCEDRPEPAVAGHTRPTHGVFALTALAGTIAFSAVVTGFTFRVFEAESFGQFYDHQAASLLKGRLDVPEAALGSEAFVFEGKHYGYFGPTPALLRLPFAVAGVGFGRLSRSFMIAAYVASLAAIYALLLHAVRRLTRRPTWPARRDVVLLVGGAGLGSTLFFVGSRAYIYHEAIIWGVAFALWGTWGTLRWLAEPARHRGWVLALACGVASVHARPPVGLFALAVLGCAAAAILLRPLLPGSGRESPRADGQMSPLAGYQWRTAILPLAVGAASVLGVLSFNGLSYLKFKSFEGAPLRHHVQYHPERLAVIEGRNFHVGNVPYGFANYVWRPNFSVRPTFPYFFIHGCDPVLYPGARIDLAENTLPLPYTMPALVFLAGVAGVLALTRWPGSRLPLAVLAAGTVPMTVALFAAVAISQRYTADFAPALITAAAFGVAALATLSPPARRGLTAVAFLLTVLAVLVTLAVTLHYQGEGVWGVPDDVKARYLAWRKAMDLLLGFSRP